MREQERDAGRPEIVIVVLGGVLQEVASTRRGRLRYRLIDLDDCPPFVADFETDGVPVDLDVYTHQVTDEPSGAADSPSSEERSSQ